MICSNAILTGIGVGQEASTLQGASLERCKARLVHMLILMLVQAASPLIAAFQFFVRDLAGMCGGVLFAFAQVRS